MAALHAHHDGPDLPPAGYYLVGVRRLLGGRERAAKRIRGDWSEGRMEGVMEE